MSEAPLQYIDARSLAASIYNWSITNRNKMLAAACLFG
jgi:hypothetical protein